MNKMSLDDLKELINTVLTNNGLSSVENINYEISLRNDLGFDSLKLAELTVRIEDIFGVDIFANGMIDKIGDIIKIVNRG
jgi:acyl carrier protein